MSELVRHPLAQALAWALVHFLWQGALLGLLAAGALWLLRYRSAQARYLVACGFLTAMALGPVATTALLRPAMTAPTATQALPAPVRTHPARPIRLEATGAPAPRTLDPYLPWVVGLWVAGVAVLSLRLVGAWLWLQRLRSRRCAPVDLDWQLRLSTLLRQLHITRSVQLFSSLAVEAPVVIGWLRPVILVPAAAFTGMAPEALEAVLAHELAHIRRHDYLVNLLQSAIEVLLFYHPAVWWLSARIRTEREDCCDDVAVALCGDALGFARALASLEDLRSRIHPEPELALAATGGSLMHRIQRLLTPQLPPSPSTRASLLGLLAVTALAAGTAMTVKTEDKKPAAAPKAKTREDARTNLVMVDNGKKTTVKSRGKVDLLPDSTELVKVGEGGSFELKQSGDGKARAFKVVRDGQGEKRTYTENGVEKAMDAEATAWAKAQIAEVKASQAQGRAAEGQARRVRVEVRRAEGEARRAEAEAERAEAEAERAGDEAERTLGAHRKVVVDVEKIHRDVAKAMEERKRMFKVLKVHPGEGEAADMDVDVDIDMDGEDLDIDVPDVPEPPMVWEEQPGKVRKHVVVVPRHGASREDSRRIEAEVLRKAIGQMQRRLEALEGRGAATPPPPPAPPKPPRAPKAVVTPAPSVSAPAVPAPMPPAPAAPPTPPPPPAAPPAPSAE